MKYQLTSIILLIEIADLKTNRHLEAAVIAFQKVRTKVMQTVLGVAEEASAAETKDNRKNSSTVESVSHKVVPKDPLTHYSLHGMTKDKLKKIIESSTDIPGVTAKLRLDGDKDALANRFREFIHTSNAQIGSSNPLDFDTIIRNVNSREKAREESSKRAKVSTKMLDKV